MDHAGFRAAEDELAVIRALRIKISTAAQVGRFKPHREALRQPQIRRDRPPCGDKLRGGADDDRVTGGAGADRFIHRPGDGFDAWSISAPQKPRSN